MDEKSFETFETILVHISLFGIFQSKSNMNLKQSFNQEDF